MIALMTLFIAASCSQDDGVKADNAGNDAKISLSIALPDSGPLTRAFGDASLIDQLVYEVYQLDKDGNIPQSASPVLKGDKDASFNPEETVTLSLLKGKSYKIAFWAQVKGTDFYNTANLLKLEVDYTGVNNDERRDAFFKTEEFTVKSDAVIDVILNRPFAQLNVGVTDIDFEKADAAGLPVTQSSVTIKDVANTINLIDGKVSGEETVTYSLATTPKEQNEGPLEVTIDEVKKEYNYVSMSYLLVEKEKSVLTSGLEFEFANADASNSVILTQGLTNVPLQRNYRTNIIGRMFTSDIDFSIIIDKLFNDEDYNEEGVLVPTE